MFLVDLELRIHCRYISTPFNSNEHPKTTQSTVSMIIIEVGLWPNTESRELDEEELSSHEELCPHSTSPSDIVVCVIQDGADGENLLKHTSEYRQNSRLCSSSEQDLL